MAHVEASTEYSILLAGVYLKVGFIGYCRYVTSCLHEFLHYGGPVLQGVTIAGLLSAAAHLYFYQDIKRFVASSSLVHVGVALWGV